MTPIGSLGSAFAGHRRVDADRFVTGALVFAVTVVFIAVVYVVMVIGLGSRFGDEGESSTVLSVAATVVVAVAFQPVRRWAERLVNRLVLGRRATPYQVLSEFTRRVAVSSDNLVDDAARYLAEGTGANRVVVSIAANEVGGATTIEAVGRSPQDPDTPTEAWSFPVVDGDRVLGSLDVHLPADRELRAEDRRLARQLASTMGLALRNQLLTEGLEARVRELRESRRTLVAVQDATRRRLERDLHDGVQQQLVALKVKLGLGRAMADADGAPTTAAALDQLAEEADGAVEAMRDFARGVHPPLLEAEGLAAAVSAEARRLPIPVVVQVDGIGRYRPEVEASVYYCINEALRNAVQHSHSDRAEVVLVQANGSLQFRITDSGTGFDPDAIQGSGLATMAERLDALSGDLLLTSAPGAGTLLRGIVPTAPEGAR